MLDLLASGEPMRATDVAKELGLSSGQKASSLLNALAKAGELVKVKGEKGATLFTLPDPDDED
jgi:Mn-dependent DtxR family transcriptional regulator